MRAGQLLSLAAVLLGIAITISRLGLIAHELIGHGAAAEALGSDVTAWGLYLFGGGWISYEHPAPLRGAAPWIISLGGIGVELVLAAGGALLARRARGAAALALSAAAWALAIHAGWYLAAGAFHGFGDGAVLHRALGDGRLWFAIPVALISVAAAYLAGRATGGRLRAMTPAASRGRQLATVAAALALALGAHAALTLGELRLRADPTYQAVMQTAGERTAARELAVELASAERAGRPLDDAAARRERDRLRRRHRQLPFGPGLLVALALAAAAGIVRSRASEAGRDEDAGRAPSPRVAALALACAAASVVLVAALDALGP